MIAAFTSRRSCEVSISSRSQPPPISAAACSRKTSASSSKWICDNSGSDDDGSFPLGPSEPATNRGRSGVEKRAATPRARAAAARLISGTSSSRPYSAMVSRFARKVQVSMTSQPASRKAACTDSTAAGFCRTR